MSDTLLQTKLYIPPLRPNLIRRPQLIERLDKGLQLGHKLTLISASAGFGKTTLASEWAAASESPAAWLSLDEGDGDAARFLVYLVAALQTIYLHVGNGALEMLQSPQPPPIESLLTTLLNEIARVPDNFILILDGYHAIDSQPVDKILIFMLDHLPPQMHLVITTREDLNLPLARYRARGQMTELRAIDLRFSPGRSHRLPQPSHRLFRLRFRRSRPSHASCSRRPRVVASNGARGADPPWIPIGVGIHTGIAFVGSVGAEGGATDITVLGDPPNVAAQMAVKAGAIGRQEGMLIQTVKGFSRATGLHVDEKREQTRIDQVSYAYKPEDRRRIVVATRQSTKKRKPTTLDDETAAALKRLRNESPQTYRDALLACLLLDHGLRASEVALHRASNIDLAKGELCFHRPKVKGTDQEWTTHKLTEDARQMAAEYLRQFYPPPLLPDSPLILATTRLLKNGEGGLLLGDPLNRVRISERIAWLGKKLGAPKLSARNCRHYCAARMARLGHGVDELMAWFGWTSAQTAMRYVTAVEVQERHRG